MRVLISLIALFLTAVVGVPTQQRILGGDLTTIDSYPFMAVLLNTNDFINYNQVCGGVILNNRSVLTAAHCIRLTLPWQWQIRVGSSYASSGGNVHIVIALIGHPDFHPSMGSEDIAIIRISSSFNFGLNIQPGTFAGADYNVADDVNVWAVGWGTTTFEGTKSEQLRHVQIKTVNQEVCRINYNIVSITVTPNEICAGNLEEGNQDTCDGDRGGPLLHNGVVLGISIHGYACGYRNYPGRYVRVPNHIEWIQNNA